MAEGVIIHYQNFFPINASYIIHLSYIRQVLLG